MLKLELGIRKGGYREMWRERTSQSAAYIAKVYGLFGFLKQYRNSREWLHIPAGIPAWNRDMGTGSINQLEQMGKDGELDEVVHWRQEPSADRRLGP